MTAECVEELETLEAIYGDEILIDKTEWPPTIKKLVHQSGGYAVLVDGPSGSNSMPVSVLVQVKCGPNYPRQPPVVSIGRPRGIGDVEVQRLQDLLDSFLLENVGNPILFEIFQKSQELLDEWQTPCLPCPICLNDFLPLVDTHSQTQRSIGTECGHFFHATCLSRNVKYWREEVTEVNRDRPAHLTDVAQVFCCPVCRSSLPKLDVEALREVEEEFESCQDRSCAKEGMDFDWHLWKEKLVEMNKMMERQKEKGGIIDRDDLAVGNLVTQNTMVTVRLPSDSTNERTINDRSNKRTSKQGRHGRTHRAPVSHCNGSSGS